jgi:hypothetical protein
MTDLLTVKKKMEKALEGVDLEDVILILAELTSEVHVNLSVKAMTEVMNQTINAMSKKV